MKDYTFTKIFFEAFVDYYDKEYSFKEEEDKQKLGKIKDYFNNIDRDLLEETLITFLHEVIGYRLNNDYNKAQVKVYFDNIVRQLNMYRPMNIIDAINEYREDFIGIISVHKYVMLFIETISKMYNSSYNGKLSDNGQIKNELAILHNKNMFSLIYPHNKEELPIPIITINNINTLELVLSEYIDAIEESDTFYNIFDNSNFDEFTNNEKIKLIFEGTILNASNYELSNIEYFFAKYRNLVLDKTLSQMRGLQLLGEAFNDELYFDVKRSDIEYETPYYFSFMLKKYATELPNVRLAIITEVDGVRKAHIIATQSSQITSIPKTLAEEIKAKIPNTSRYNFFNPEHFISLVITFGILNGMGINCVEVQDYMPLRYRKTIRDKKMNEEEGEKYIMRVVDKNIYTYFKLSLLAKGLDISCMLENGNGLQIYLNDEITFESSFLQDLYDMGYIYGHKKISEIDGEKTHE